MDVEQRLAETRQKFEDTQKRRNQLIEEANSLMTEMNQLEGQWRLLQEMQQTVAPISEDATTITAIPEEDKPNEEK